MSSKSTSYYYPHSYLNHLIEHSIDPILSLYLIQSLWYFLLFLSTGQSNHPILQSYINTIHWTLYYWLSNNYLLFINYVFSVSYWFPFMYFLFSYKSLSYLSMFYYDYLFLNIVFSLFFKSFIWFLLLSISFIVILYLALF